MGSLWHLIIGDYPISSSKGEVDPCLLSLFQRDDVRTFERKIGDRNKLIYSIDSEFDDEIEKAVEYSISASNLKQRLEIIGFTMKNVKLSFSEDKQSTIDRLKGYLNDNTFNKNPEFLKSIKSDISLLENSSFEDFIDASKEIIDKKIVRDNDLKDFSGKVNPLIFYLLKGGYGLDNFPYHYDQRNLLRALLEIIPSETTITYDITEFVDEDFDGNIEDIYDYYIGISPYEHQLGEKILILSEGPSDINILQRSLKLLYPHLTDYYSFMDFGVSNASGSAASVVSSIKSFVGTGIKNRIIALFDNDTSANSAIRGLKNSRIPNNIKVMKYPALEFARTYPTIGPSGITNLDINGLACSIELYLGTDILINKGKFIPIQWKGYDSTLKKYQGEIIEKDKIQKLFYKKLSACEKNKTLIEQMDWSSIELIFSHIFNAFNDDPWI